MGPPGPQGEDGLDGERGPKGDTGATGAQGTSGGGLTFTALIKDLGVSNRSGSFDITGLAGLTADKQVLVSQSAAVIASKGNARDELEIEPIHATGYVVNSSTLRVYWNAANVVVGEYAFGYTVSG